MKNLIVTNTSHCSSSNQNVFVCCALFNSRSRGLRQQPGACDVNSDVMQLSTDEFVANTRHSDVTHPHQQQQRTTGRSSAAVKCRMESSSSSSSSSGITRKRQRYEYNEVQRRLLCDAYAKRKSIKYAHSAIFVVQSIPFVYYTFIMFVACSRLLIFYWNQPIYRPTKYRLIFIVRRTIFVGQQNLSGRQ